MRLLLLTEFFPADKRMCFTGGVEARTFYLAKYLAKNNQVLVICRKTKKLTGFKKIDNIYIYPCGFKSLNVPANFFSIFERLIFMVSAFVKSLSLKFDLVEGSNFVTFLPAFLAAKIKNKPAVAWYADILGKDWLKYFGFTGLFGRLMEKISLFLPWNRIIALSQSTQGKLIKMGMNPKNIDVIYGGVDFKKSPANNRQLKLNKKKDIICISRLVKYKRIKDLLMAFNNLNKRYPYLNLVIVGQGPEEKNLHRWVEEHNLTKKVDFFKNLSRKKLFSLLRQSYLFCLPSVVEGFGLATIEAAVCGVPYVISNIKVNQEITKNGQGGLLFQAQNIEDLTQKIDFLLSHKKIYQEKQVQVLNLAKNYSWDKIALDMQKIYFKASK